MSIFDFFSESDSEETPAAAATGASSSVAPAVVQQPKKQNIFSRFLFGNRDNIDTMDYGQNFKSEGYSSGGKVIPKSSYAQDMIVGNSKGYSSDPTKVIPKPTYQSTEDYAQKTYGSKGYNPEADSFWGSLTEGLTAGLSDPVKSAKEFQSGFQKGSLGLGAAAESGVGLFHGLTGDQEAADYWGKKAKEDRQLLSYLQTPDDPNDKRTTTQKLKDPSFLFESVGELIPSVIASGAGAIGAAYLGAPAALAAGVGGATNYLLTAGSEYSDALEGGATDSQAKKVALGSGALQSAIDFIPLGRLLKRIPGGEEIKRTFAEQLLRGIKSMGEQSLLEYGTGASQQLISNAWAKTYDKNRKLFDGVNENGILEAIGGGLADVGITGINKAVVLANGGLKPVTKEIHDTGISKEEFVNQFNDAAAKTDDDDMRFNTQVFQKILAESGVTPDQFYDAAQKLPTESTGVTPDLTPLAKEAQKYKSADEFVTKLSNANVGEIIHDVPVSSIRKSEFYNSELAKAQKEIADGTYKRSSNEPIRLFLDAKTSDYVMVDGYHRLAKILNEGKGTIKSSIETTSNKQDLTDIYNKARTAFQKKSSGDTNMEVSRQEGIQKLNEYKKRLNVDFDTVLFDKIYTGAVNNGVAEQAYGLMKDNSIGLAQKIQKFTADHEVGHLIFRNLENIPVFKGITRAELIAELKTKYPDKKTTADLEEQLQVDYEKYVAQRQAKKPVTFYGKIRNYFRLLYDATKKMLSINPKKVSQIEQFYKTLATGKGKEKVDLRTAEKTDDTVFQKKKKEVEEPPKQEDTPKQFNRNAVLSDELNDTFNDHYVAMQRAQGVEPDMIENLKKGITAEQAIQEILYLTGGSEAYDVLDVIAQDLVDADFEDVLKDPNSKGGYGDVLQSYVKKYATEKWGEFSDGSLPPSPEMPKPIPAPEAPQPKYPVPVAKKIRISGEDIEVPDEFAQMAIDLQLRRESIDTNPLRGLKKYVARNGEFAGQLPEVTGKEGGSVFSQKGDTIIDEVLGTGDVYRQLNDVEEVRDRMEKYLRKEKQLKQEERDFADEVKTYMNERKSAIAMDRMAMQENIFNEKVFNDRDREFQKGQERGMKFGRKMEKQDINRYQKRLVGLVTHMLPISERGKADILKAIKGVTDADSLDRATDIVNAKIKEYEDAVEYKNLIAGVKGDIAFLRKVEKLDGRLVNDAKKKLDIGSVSLSDLNDKNLTSIIALQKWNALIAELKNRVDFKRQNKVKYLRDYVQLKADPSTFQKFKDTAKEFGSTALNLIERRLRNISPQLEKKVSSVYQSIASNVSRRMDRLAPVTDVLTKAKDDITLKKAIIDGDSALYSKLLLEKGVTQEQIDESRYVFDDIQKELNNVGVKTPYRRNFYPRKFKPLDVDSANLILAVKEEQMGRKFTAEEKAAAINVMVRGFNMGERVLLSGKQFEQSRLLETVPEDLLYLYEDPAVAMEQYVRQATTLIETRKLFGKYALNIDNFEQPHDKSIGSYVYGLLAEGKIQQKDIAELTDILGTIFSHRLGKTHQQIVQGVSNVVYPLSLGQATSVINQLKDLSQSLLVNDIFAGELNTFGSQKYTPKDFYMDDERAQLDSELTPAKMSEAIMKPFSELGDKPTLRLFINGAYRRLLKAAKRSDPWLSQLIEDIYGADRVGEIMQQMQSKNGKEDGSQIEEEIKRLVWNEVSKVRPLSKLQKTEGALRAPLMYTLKNFTLKQMELVRSEAIDVIAQGVKNKDKKQVGKGLAKLSAMVVVFSVLGATVDQIKDWISKGVTNSFSSDVWDNILQLVGIGNYNITQGQKNGPARAIGEAYLSPASASILYDTFDKTYKDIMQATKGEKSIKDFFVVQKIPMVGNILYNRFGGGSKYIEDQKKSEENKPYNDAFKEKKDANKAEFKKLQPRFDEIVKAGFGSDEADEIYYNFTDAEQATYKKMKAAYMAKQLEETKKRIFPIFEKAKKAGLESVEAFDLTKDFDEEEMKAYTALEKSLGGDVESTETTDDNETDE